MSVGDLCPVLFFHTSIEPNALSSGSVREFNFAGFSFLRALARRIGTTDHLISTSLGMVAAYINCSRFRQVQTATIDVRLSLILLSQEERPR